MSGGLSEPKVVASRSNSPRPNSAQVNRKLRALRLQTSRLGVIIRAWVLLGSIVACVALAACRKPAVELPSPPVAPVRPVVAAKISDSAELSPRAVDVVPTFSDVAKQVGIDFTFHNDEVAGRYFLPEVMGGGGAWFDYDLDGWLDLYLVDGGSLTSPETASSEHPNRLYRGDGKSFREVAALAVAQERGAFGQGCCVGDFDADGFPDLYLANYGPNQLLRNNGDGTFQDVTLAAGVGDALWGTSPVWVDLNGDGLLDLFVTNYLDATRENIQVCQYDNKPGYCGPGAHAAAPDRAYLSNGDGTFTEAAEALGLSAANGKGLAVAVVDFDGDAIPEIYVANDMADNFLYRRVMSTTGGEGVRYENVAGTAGCSVSGDGSLIASMGLACADFDGDSLVDIFVTNFYSHGNVLYRNLGDLLFVDDRRRSRIAASSFQNLGFGTVSLDYDRDGARDLFVVNGHVLGPLQTPHAMHPQLLHNDGTGRFDDVSKLAGQYFEDLWLGRGAAGADFDNDGDVDLVATHLHRPLVLLRNDTHTGRHFIGIALRSQDRLPPLGGRVVVTAGERKLSLPVVGAGSYLSHSDERLLFGLDQWAEAVDVVVYWPSGKVDRHPGLAADRYWTIREGGPAEPSALPPQADAANVSPEASPRP
jgi:enediyne biosynthesis protein E4